MNAKNPATRVLQFANRVFFNANIQIDLITASGKNINKKKHIRLIKLFFLIAFVAIAAVAADVSRNEKPHFNVQHVSIISFVIFYP